MKIIRSEVNTSLSKLMKEDTTASAPENPENQNPKIPLCDEPGCTCIVKHYHGVRRVDGKSAKGLNGGGTTLKEATVPQCGFAGCVVKATHTHTHGVQQQQQQQVKVKQTPRLRVPPDGTPDPLDRVNLTAMQVACTIGIDDFDKLGQRVDTVDGSYIFIDRGAKILAIAHRDTVCPAKGRFQYVPQEMRVYTPTLDDRLGCIIILDILDRILPPNSYDILLTEGEEEGRSTAKYFEPPEGKEYNWMFQFDRGGTDIVHYQFTEPDWMEKLKGTDIKVEKGMFSDICYLDHLGICGVNWGCAYYQYHSANAYCNLDETVSMVEKFALFFSEWKDTKFSHDPEKYDKMGEKKYYSYSNCNYQYINIDDSSEMDQYTDFVESYYDSIRDLPTYPHGHAVTCTCQLCTTFWTAQANAKQDRYDKWNEFEQARVARDKRKRERGRKSQHLYTSSKVHDYSSICVCYDCTKTREEFLVKDNREEVGTSSRFKSDKSSSKKSKKNEETLIEKAKRFLHFRTVQPKPLNTWDCLNCGEEVSSDLLECFNCQAPQGDNPELRMADWDDSSSDSKRLIPAQRKPLSSTNNNTRSKNNKRELLPMTCQWCDVPNQKRLRTVSGGDLLCDTCFEYVKSGKLEQGSDDNMPLHLM